MGNLKKKNENGITLVALGVTIIVLVILATITISTTIGDNGIINKAKEAKELHENKIASDEEELRKLMEEYNNEMYGSVIGLHEVLLKQIESLKVGSANCTNGVSMIQTAESSLNDIRNMLNRINELLVRYANSETATDTESLEKEIEQHIESINALGRDTKFGDIYILDGSLSDENPYIIECGNGYFEQGKMEVVIDEISFKNLYGVSEIDYTDIVGAITKIRTALEKVSGISGKIASVQNGIEWTIGYLDAQAENMTNLNDSIFQEDGNDYEQIIKNANSWNTTSNFILIIDESLEIIENILLRIEELTKSSITSVANTDRTSLQQEVEGLLNEIDRILTYTGVENKKFFDGTYPYIEEININILEINNISILTQDEATSDLTKIENALSTVQKIRSDISDKNAELQNKLTEKADKGYSFDIE